MTSKISEMEKGLEEKIADRTKKIEEAKSGLETAVAEKTRELQEKVTELEKVNSLMIGRELEITKMKEELRKLRGQ